MMANADSWDIGGYLGPAIVVAALLATSAVIVLLTPLFRRFALAVPTARSSHKELTPQWGGLAVVAATTGLTLLVMAAFPQTDPAAGARLYLVLGAAVWLAAVGAIDDVHSLGALPKFFAQGLAILLVIAALPPDVRMVPALPWWLERALLFGAGLWFVNLVNFMDGIDWMMVVEVVPITAGVAVIAALGAVPLEGLVVALTLNGAMLGFAPFNRPVARLFLGDMGSLPAGALMAWLLFLVAGAGHIVAALLLPLYFLADATITLLCRLLSGQRVWEAHRTHFYQRAGDNGFSTMEIVSRVFALNCCLVALALLSVVARSPLASVAALLLGAALVTWLLMCFSRGRL